MVQDGRFGQLAVGDQPVDRILRGHKGTGDAGGAGAAVSLQHIAVEVNGALAQFFQIEHRTHGAADQALDFLRAAALFAACGLAVAAGMGGAGEHAVFSRHPALAAAFFVARHFFFDRSSAQDAGVAKLDQHRAFGVNGVATGDAHLAQGIGRAASALVGSSAHECLSELPAGQFEIMAGY